MTIYFEEVSEGNLFIALEIVNSNPVYNRIENGCETRNISEIEKEFLNNETKSYFIKLDDTYIGILDLMKKNPKDDLPWLGLFMIHRDYQGYGFGFQAYLQFEKELLEQGIEVVRLGVLEDNKKAQVFWESLGFAYYKKVEWQNKNFVLCYEKLNK